MKKRIWRKAAIAGVLTCILNLCSGQSAFAREDAELVVFNNGTETTVSDSDSSSSINWEDIIVDTGKNVDTSSKKSLSMSAAAALLAKYSKLSTKKIVLSAKQIRLARRDRYTITVYRVPLGANDVLKFYSSNKKVAKVSQKGVVSGRSKGRAVITVKSGKRKARLVVIVY